MNNRDVSARFDEATARIESMIYLAAEAYDTRGSDAFQAFAEDSDNDEQRIAEIFSGRASLDGSFEPEDMLDAIIVARCLGFLVQFATPVRTWRGESSCQFSWGYYRTHWVYAETLEEAISAGLAWAEASAQNDRTAKGSGE